MNAQGSAARLSVVLATDTYETLVPAIGALQRQTARRQLELIIVVADDSMSTVDSTRLDGFAAVRIVRVPAPLSLPAARAAGIRAASAPFVFVGETHCFPQPDMADRLVAAFTDPHCAAVGPAILNANPVGALSWASYLTDYGTWGPGRPAGSLERGLLYNGAYRRAVLMALDDRLDELLDVSNEELWPILVRQGYHARFLPDARTDHVNAVHFDRMMRIRFFTGILIGAQRRRRWGLPRRLIYILGSPLVPVVLVWRIRSIVPFAAPRQELPAGTMLGVAMGAVAKAFGELLGYLGFTLKSAEGRLTDNELHKLRYAGADASAKGL